MTDVATLAIAVDSLQVRTAQLELDKLAQQGAKAETATKSLTTATDLLAKAAQMAAGAFALYKLVDYAKDAAILNARYETLGISMTIVGANAGYTASQMEASAVAMQHTGISMVESRQQAMRLVQAHIDLSKSTELARIAQDAAVIGNMNSSEAFAHMIHGIQTMQPEVLRTIGLNVSMEQSYKNIAAELHKNVNQLTQNEKMQGVLNSVMKAGADIAGTYEAAMGTAGKQLKSMERYLEDLKVRQGEVFNEVLTVAVMAFTEHLKDSNKELDEMAKNGELKAWGQDIAKMFVSVANAIDNMVTGLKMASQWVAHLGAQSDIRGKYDAKLETVKDDGSFTTASKRAAIAAERDAALKKEQDFYEGQQVEMAKSADRFDRAYEERQKAKAEKDKASADAEREHGESMVRIQKFYADQLTKGLISEKQYLETVTKLNQAAYGDNHHYADTAPPPNKTLSPFQTAKNSMGGDNAKLEAEIKYMDEFHGATTKANQALIEFETTYGKFKDLSKGEKSQLINLAKIKDNLEERKRQEEEFYKFEKHLNEQSQADDNKYASDKYDTVINSTRALEDETKKINASLILDATDRAYAELEIEKQKWVAIIGMAKEGSEEKAKLEEGYQKWLGAKTAKIQTDSMKGVFDIVEKTGHDAFYAVFTRDGTNAVQAMGKAIQSSIIDMLYQMTVKKWIIDVTANVTGTGGSSAGGGMSMLGGLGDLFGGMSGGGYNAAAADAVWSESATVPTWMSSLMSFDVGTDYVPRDMVAKIHQGEKIIPASQNTPGAQSGNYSVNVNVDASGSKVSGDADSAKILGAKVEQAVRKVIMTEKRPGGMLS